MKIAFLFLTIDNHRQGTVWEDFFRPVADTDYRVYCHPKFPDKVDQPFLKHNILAETVDTQYSGISSLRASLLLLKHAVQDPDNQFFIMLSESCVPLYPFATIRERLTATRKCWIAHGFDRRQENVNRWSKMTDPAFVPLEQFRKQHAWMVLTRDVAVRLLQEDFTPMFEHMYAVEEYYVINLLERLGVDISRDVYNQMCTFVNWHECEVETGPPTRVRPKTYRTLSVQDVWYARSMGSLFLRKVTTECDCSALTTANQKSLKFKTLTPVKGKKSRPFWTVIVAGSEERARGLKTLQKMDAADVQILTTDALPGEATFYSLVNRALADARGEWIHILPSICRLPPRFYPRLRKTLSALDGGVGIVCCRYVHVDDDGGEFTPDPWRDGPGVLDQNWATTLCDGNPLNISAVVFRRTVFETVGIFSEDLPACADWELYLRAVLNTSWWYEPALKVTHRSRREAPEVEAQGEANGRHALERTTILWRRERPDLALPEPLAESYHFMSPADQG